MKYGILDRIRQSSEHTARLQELQVQGHKYKLPPCCEEFNIAVSAELSGIGWGKIGDECPGFRHSWYTIN